MTKCDFTCSYRTDTGWCGRPDGGYSCEYGHQLDSNEHIATEYVSHQCAICKDLELPYGKVTAHDFWICPSCRQKIGKMIGVKITEL